MQLCKNRPQTLYGRLLGKVMDSLVNELYALMKHRENAHLEFKEAKNNYDSDKLTQYCCALANEGGGKIILGVYR